MLILWSRFSDATIAAIEKGR